MAVRVPKVKALATTLPRALLFHRDFVLRQPRFPVRQLRSGNREGDMKLAAAVMRRLDLKRTTLLKQQQDLPIAGLHRAAAFSEIADDAKPEDPFVKSNGNSHILDVQRRLENSFGLRTHADPPVSDVSSYPDPGRTEAGGQVLTWVRISRF